METGDKVGGSAPRWALKEAVSGEPEKGQTHGESQADGEPPAWFLWLLQRGCCRSVEHEEAFLV